jgi:CDP-diacylglycerol--glycerol-3-phosphate 3-phosphatidyltransferase
MVTNTNESARHLHRSGKGAIADWAHRWVEVAFGPIARLLVRLRVSPNLLTILGFVAGVAAAVPLAVGRRPEAIALMVLSGFLDAMDGLVARVSHKSSRFGAFLDSVLDRWADSAFFLGLIIWYLNVGLQHPVLLAAYALVSSSLVSYTKARAEGIGVQCGRGVFTRLERIVVLVAGLVFNQMVIALWIIAILSTFTAVQRLYTTLRYVNANPEG